MIKLTIKAVLEDFDMRGGTLGLVQHPIVDGLEEHECVVAINAIGDRARVVLSNRVLLSWWRDKEAGEDVASLATLNAALGLANVGVEFDRPARKRAKSGNRLRKVA